MDAPEILAIFGARQVGKTTLMKHIFHSLEEPKIFLDFEDPVHIPVKVPICSGNGPRLI